MRLIVSVLLILFALALFGWAQSPRPGGEYGAIYVGQFQQQGVVTFQSPFTTWSTCVVTPMSDLGNRSYWIKSSLTTATVYLSRPGGATFFSYICRGF